MERRQNNKEPLKQSRIAVFGPTASLEVRRDRRNQPLELLGLAFGTGDSNRGVYSVADLLRVLAGGAVVVISWHPAMIAGEAKKKAPHFWEASKWGKVELIPRPFRVL